MKLKALLVALAAALAALAVPGVLAEDPPPPYGGGRPPRVLADLRVGEASHEDTYRRAVFGDWVDADRDSCDTRDEVLIRDLHYEKVTRPCTVVAGRFTDPYTGVTGEAIPRVLDIDHVVSLGDAWRSGAWSWPREQLRAFTNDQANLVATNRTQNRRKGDKGPGEWVPPNVRHHCKFARTYAAVKGKYRLTVTPADRAALARLLKGCR